MPSEVDWEKTLHAFLPRALSMALRMCGSLPAAEDAVQDAIVKIIQHRGTFRGQAGLDTWMLQIVLNACRDWLRKNRRLVHFDEGPSTEHAAENVNRVAGTVNFGDLELSQLACLRSTDPLVEDARRETREEIRLAVEQLPQRQREVVQLLVWQDLPAHEVAQLLSTSVQNVYANFHAAKQQLKRDTNRDLIDES